MRVLVLSVTAGEGHNTCAKAVIEALEKKGAVCELLDTINYVSSIAGAVTDKGYQMLGKISPAAFGKMYESALASSVKQDSIALDDLMGEQMAKKLAEYIADYAPDAIVTTHVFAALLLSHLREKSLCDTLLIGINTDFSIHPFWEHVAQDHFVLACEEMYYSVLLRSIPKEIILPLGLPVYEKFTIEVTSADARKDLGLPALPTITMMSGSMGYGHMEKHLQQLDALPLDFQVVTICGNNKEAYKKIEAAVDKGAFTHTVHNHGYINNVDAYMQAADILVTKPGGLSTSECLNVARPLVLIEPIPGLEEFNAAFLVNSGAAAFADDHYGLAEAVYNLLSSEGRREQMMRAQASIHPGHAAAQLADFIYRRVESGVDACAVKPAE